MTDTTLAERLARCVREWQSARKAAIAQANSGDLKDLPRFIDRLADAEKALAALDMDALAQEVEAMVGAEREAIAAWLEAHDYYTAGAERGFSPARFPGMDQHHKAIAAAIRAREGGKP
jgi:hypothetical protein